MMHGPINIRIFNYFTFERFVKMLLVKFFVFVVLMDNIGQDVTSFIRKKQILRTTYDAHKRGADKSLARPRMKQAIVSVRMA